MAEKKDCNCRDSPNVLMLCAKCAPEKFDENSTGRYEVYGDRSKISNQGMKLSGNSSVINVVNDSEGAKMAFARMRRKLGLDEDEKTNQ